MFISRVTPARRKHLRGLLRATAYVACLTLVGVGLQIRAARAEMGDRTVELGRQMVQLANATEHDVNKISFNGQGIWVGSSLARDDVKNVLDRYEAYCTQNGAQPTNAWRDLADKSDATVDKSFLSTGVLRGGTAEEGSVVCFTKGNGSKPTIAEAMKAFAETGNLGALGAMRYVYAKKSDRGQTVVLTAWTDDDFNLHRLVPEEGTDAIGAEFTDVPRTPDSDRVVSTRIEGTPFGVNVYRGKDAPSKVAAFYDTEMRNRGWTAIDPEVTEKSEDGTPAVARLYERDGVVLSLGSKIEEGATFSALGLAGVNGVGDGRNAKVR